MDYLLNGAKLALAAVFVTAFHAVPDLAAKLGVLKLYSQLMGSGPAVALAQTDPTMASQATLYVNAINGNTADAITAALDEAKSHGYTGDALIAYVDGKLQLAANAAIENEVPSGIERDIIESIVDPEIKALVTAAYDHLMNVVVPAQQAVEAEARTAAGVALTLAPMVAPDPPADAPTTTTEDEAGMSA